MEKRKKLMAFDLDGTLFDTAGANYYAYRDAALKFGIDMDQATFLREASGKDYKDFLPLFGVHEIKILEQIHEEKKRIYVQYLSKVRINRHLFELIRCVKGEYQIGLVTTASHKNVDCILKTFGVEEYFDFIVAKENVKKIKPDPECFLNAMKRAGVSPEDTVIFEDSRAGIDAAVGSGAMVIKIEKF